MLAGPHSLPRLQGRILPPGDYRHPLACDGIAPTLLLSSHGLLSSLCLCPGFTLLSLGKTPVWRFKSHCKSNLGSTSRSWRILSLTRALFPNKLTFLRFQVGMNLSEGGGSIFNPPDLPGNLGSFMTQEVQSPDVRARCLHDHAKQISPYTNPPWAQKVSLQQTFTMLSHWDFRVNLLPHGAQPGLAATSSLVPLSCNPNSVFEPKANMQCFHLGSIFSQKPF